MRHRSWSDPAAARAPQGSSSFTVGFYWHFLSIEGVNSQVFGLLTTEAGWASAVLISTAVQGTLTHSISKHVRWGIKTALYRRQEVRAMSEKHLHRGTLFHSFLNCSTCRGDCSKKWQWAAKKKKIKSTICFNTQHYHTVNSGYNKSPEHPIFLVVISEICYKPSNLHRKSAVRTCDKVLLYLTLL